MFTRLTPLFAVSGAVVATAALGALLPLSADAEAAPAGAAATPAAMSAAALSAAASGYLELLTPQNSTLLLIDHQPQMFFGVHSHDVATVRNNVAGLAKAAKAFDVPTTLTTVASKSFSGPLVEEIRSVFPDHPIYDRTSMNSWDDKRVVDELKGTGRKKLVLAALWTEVCATLAALDALNDGFEVYVVTDASGGTTTEAHDMAVDRMVQAGAVPVTWQQVMLEWQRDWARSETYEAVNGIAMEHSGGYGLGITYARTMFGGKEGGND